MVFYSTESADIKHKIDKYVTGNFGEDSVPTRVCCDHCGGLITKHELYFSLDSAVYCMDCREYAEADILNNVCKYYIYEL